MFRNLPIYTLLTNLTKATCSWYIKVSFLAIIAICINVISIYFSEKATLRVMKAFHLSSNNYSEWALEQVTPRMYNFSNYSKSASAKEQVNHYPTRLMTFVNSKRKLRDQATFHISSEYRGTRLETIFLVSEKPENKFSLLKIKQQESYENREN